MRKQLIEEQLDGYYCFCKFTRGMPEKAVSFKRQAIGYFVNFSGVKRVEEIRTMDAKTKRGVFMAGKKMRK